MGMVQRVACEWGPHGAKRLSVSCAVTVIVDVLSFSTCVDIAVIIDVTVDGGNSWSGWYNQPTGQFYHVATDNRFPYWVYAGQQDNTTIARIEPANAGAVIRSLTCAVKISLADGNEEDAGGRTRTA